MFRFFASDRRFSNIEVGNEGTTSFVVYKGKKVIDSFERVETPLTDEVSLQFAEQEAKNFFDKLDISNLLQQIYERA